MCDHPNMISSARTDFCPDCGYEFYYGDAHAPEPLNQSRLVRPGYDVNRDEYEGDLW